MNILPHQLKDDDFLISTLKEEIENAIDLYAAANMHNVLVKNGHLVKNCQELLFHVKYRRKSYKLISILKQTPYAYVNIPLNNWGTEKIGFHLAQKQGDDKKDFIFYLHDNHLLKNMSTMFSNHIHKQYEKKFEFEINNQDLINPDKISQLYKSLEEAQSHHSRVHTLRDMKFIFYFLKKYTNSSTVDISLNINRGHSLEDNHLNHLIFTNDNGEKKLIRIEQPMTFFTSNMLQKFPQINSEVAPNGFHEVIEIDLSQSINNFNDFYNILLDSERENFDRWLFQNNLEQNLDKKTNNYFSKKI